MGGIAAGVEETNIKESNAKNSEATKRCVFFKDIGFSLTRKKNLTLIEEVLPKKSLRMLFSVDRLTM
jgi:hypothetical protein